MDTEFPERSPAEHWTRASLSKNHRTPGDPCGKIEDGPASPVINNDSSWAAGLKVKGTTVALLENNRTECSVWSCIWGSKIHFEKHMKVITTDESSCGKIQGRLDGTGRS